MTTSVQEEKEQDGTGVIIHDPYLQPFAENLKQRYAAYKFHKERICKFAGSVGEFALGYRNCGLFKVDEGIMYREWAPNAKEAHLIGDFNNWDRLRTPMTRDELGWWSCVVPDIPHKSQIKVEFVLPSGERVDRLPAWTRATQQRPTIPTLDALCWNPKEPYKFLHPRPKKPERLHIYEVHIGIATEHHKIGTYLEFIEHLPYIAKTGYNALQLMAIMEHSYYASFGYQVTNFFAPSHRFGPPEDLMKLIDEAHGHGIIVLLDLVHAHASRNVLDGLNMFDGTDNHFFHSGPRGHHGLWDSRMFDYGNVETQRFLLSNVRYWVDEFGFDGFRFDGITAMMYHHRGISTGFAGDYREYFSGQADHDAMAYLMLANEMLHEVYPFIVTIAEDVSGMPALCIPVSEGGIGFDYRLAMGLPDLWEKTVQLRDEDWDMGRIVHVLTDQRYKEPVIAYAESHDQCIVGSKTIAFWLMDKEMYDGMTILVEPSLIIDRGIALHKMIRLITCALGGYGYLTFMGNEFGHPEWVDFPREGNGYSHHYARRQWRLRFDGLLRYQHLGNFEEAMLQAENKYQWLSASNTYVSLKHEGDKVIVFERGPLVWAFNFHPTQSFTDYRIGTNTPGTYRCVLNTDETQFGGHARIDSAARHVTEPGAYCNREHSMLVYLPSRTAIMYALAEDE